MSLNTKTIALHLFRYAGLFRFANLIYKSHIRILAYHRFWEGYITPQLFESQIKYLKRHFNIIKLESYLDFLLRKKELPPNSVIITVDDGYQDFYNVVFPILRKYAVPATVFLTVDFIDKGIWLWHDLLNFGISNTSRADFTLNGKVFDLTNRRGRAELKLSLDGICTSCTTAGRDEFISQVLKELGVTAPKHATPDYAPLTWNQIVEMSRFGVSYGSHTCTHPILSKISLNEALQEIQESKHRIEEVMQRDIMAFCYPNGNEDDFNETIKEMVRECGYICAMSMIYGMNDSGSDRYELRRIGADGRSFTHFLHDVSGFGVLRTSLNRVKKKMC